MCVMHKPRGFIRTDGQQSNIDRSEPFANLDKTVEIAGIAGKEVGTLAGGHDPATPEGRVPTVFDALRPMLHWYTGHLPTPMPRTLPPIKFSYCLPPSFTEPLS